MTVEEAFTKRLHNGPVTTSGIVIKILADDNGETPHQRFIIELHRGHTLLVAHNLLRAYRVPVKLGDKVEIHGTYVWNKYGGIVHNTHHYGGECVGGTCDPHEDGYINFFGLKKPNVEKIAS